MGALQLGLKLAQEAEKFSIDLTPSRAILSLLTIPRSLNGVPGKLNVLKMLDLNMLDNEFSVEAEIKIPSGPLPLHSMGKAMPSYSTMSAFRPMG